MTLYPTWWRNHFLGVELAIAVLAGCALTFWIRVGDGSVFLSALVHQNRAQIYGTLASIFGSLLGFVITSMSIVLGFSASERLGILRKSSHYRDMWAVFTSAIKALGATTALWLAALLFERESAPKPLLIDACICVTLLSLFRLARCVWVLEKIVEVLTV